MKVLLLICCSTLLFISNECFAQNWKLLDQLGSSDQKAADHLGISVDISDSLLIAGAWGSEGNSGINSSGAVYIYRLQEDGAYEEEVKLSSPNPEFLGYFGFRVAISGRNAMVGAFNEDHSGLGNAGRVYVYHLSVQNEWILSDTLSVESSENADYFGYDIAMIDDYALIGAYRHPLDQNGENSIKEAGAAFLFRKETTNKWTLVQKLVAPDRTEKDFFGRHVSLDRGGLAISAFNKDGTGSITEAGVAYAIKCEGNCHFENLGIQDMKKIEDSDPDFGLQFGWDVGISGNWLAVGKRSNSEDPDGSVNSNIGSVYFYKWEGGNWVEKQQVYASDFGSNAHFGERIALEGAICVIGAGGESKDENGENEVVRSGAAYVFEMNNEEVWVQKQKLVGRNRSFTDLYAGDGLAIDENRFVAGAWLADTINGSYLIDGGTVYVYEREGDLPSNIENIDPEVKIVLANNPSEGPVIFITKENFIGNLQVFSLNGSKVHDQKLTINQRKTVDLSQLDKGLYWIKVFSNEGSQIHKWVKQ